MTAGGRMQVTRATQGCSPSGDAFKLITDDVFRSLPRESFKSIVDDVLLMTSWHYASQ